MSVIILTVDEVMRTLSSDGQYPFVVNDKTVDIVRFALNTGFTDVVLDEHSALRVMYQRPRETEVRAQTLTYYDTDGLRNYYDWQLLNVDLEKKGVLTVALCILRTDSTVEEWHTTPCQIRVLDTIHTDDSDEGDESITPTVAQRVAILESVVQGVAGGAPIVVGDASEMVDTDQIYVLSTDGMWYYYDGTAWAAGGEYGAVATDTTLTQSGMPADAKAVGDVLAEMSALTGETLEDDEVMKYALSSKYDDFKLVNGYGYFDAVKLLSSVTDLTKPSYVTNRVFRITPPNTSSRNVLIDFTEPTEIFSPDFPMYKEVEWPGSYDTLGSMPEGYWYSKDPSRSDLYYTIPMESYGSATSFGDFAFNLLDGSIGIKMDSTKIREYDPSEVISAITSGGSISTVTTEDTTFYKGFLTYTWTDLFDFERTNIVLYRMYNNLGFCEEYTGYAKECVWLEGTTRIWYRVKANAVSAKTIDAIKDYLVNTRHLKFYYVAEEVTA